MMLRIIFAMGLFLSLATPVIAEPEATATIEATVEAQGPVQSPDVDAAASQNASTDLASKIPEPPENAPWWLSMVTDLMGNFPDVNGWLIAVLLFLSVGLRATAELLGFIALKTDTDKDDKAAATLAKAALWSGSLLGWFGGGKPKTVEKAKEKAA